MKLGLLKKGGPDEAPVTVVERADGTLLEVDTALRAFAASKGVSPAVETTTSPLAIAQQVGIYAPELALADEGLTRAGRIAEFSHPAGAALAAPLRPNRVLAIGRNYAEHAKELGNAVPDDPIVFLKAGDCVIGPGDAIEIPSWLGRVDFEGELVVVLGSGGRNIPAGDAMRHVVAYSAFNDITAREKQKAAQEKRQPWFLAKGMDTFGPLGPFLVTADAIPDPHALRLGLTQNGETRQDGTTADMIYKIPFLISYLSRWFALKAGDTIATGTPSGVGPMLPGDTLAVTIEGIGTLKNPVVAVD